MAETKRSAHKHTAEITWRAAEYEYMEKGALWYWLAGVAAAFLAILSLWWRNFFFAVFVILAAGMVIFFGRRRPAVMEFRITEAGAHMGRKFLPFENVEDFSIRVRPRHLDEIVLKKKVMVNPYVRIPIDSKLAGDARAILNKILPEVEYKESLVDLFSEMLGF